MKKTFHKKDLPKIAKEILTTIAKARSGRTTVIALSGDLGAGKTTLTQEIARQLGVKGNVISPTFLIMKKYEVKDKYFKHLIHIDAYRLNSSQELLNLGWEDLRTNKENLILLEWPERVPECIPDNSYNVLLKHHDEEIRDIEM